MTTGVTQRVIAPDLLVRTRIDTVCRGVESFYMYQVALNGSVDYRLSDHWSVGDAASLNMINNYDRFNYKTPPVVPSVR
ncbi:MAG: YjbH domain-containing protein [Candidatus Malihini olakiniferum]